MTAVNKRLVEIDVAVGITMLLVVIGHNYFHEGEQVEWYKGIRNYIYTFHMALFMFLSGFIVMISYKPVESRKDYSGYVMKKVKKFLLPYLILSAIFILIETYRNHLTFRDVIPLIHQTAFMPIHGPATFLWYLYVLLIYYMITPFLVKLSVRNSLIVLVLSIVLVYVPVTPYFSLEPAARFFFYFFAGLLAARHYEQMKNLVKFLGIPSLVLLILFYYFYITGIAIPKQVTAIISVFAVLGVASSLAVQKLRLFQLIGKYTFQIYLLNSLIIGTVYVVFLKSGMFGSADFSLFLVVSVSLGLFIPCILTYFFRLILKKMRSENV